jgi:hypothetical protein
MRMAAIEQAAAATERAIADVHYRNLWLSQYRVPENRSIAEGCRLAPNPSICDSAIGA